MKFSRKTGFILSIPVLWVLLFLFFEISLRFFYPALMEERDRMRIRADQESERAYSVLKQPDPYLFWRLKPHQPLVDDEKLNRFGFRGPEFSIRKPDSTYRIICLGDSRSFGFGVAREQDTYCGRLRAYLNQRSSGLRFEVINLSVLGYTSFQGKRLFEIFGQSLSPDLVLVFFGYNDLLYFHITDEEFAGRSPVIAKTQQILNEFSLYHLLRKWVEGITRSRDRPIQVDQRIVRRVPLDNYRKNLRDIVAMARKNNSRVAFITTAVRKFPPLVLNAKRIRFKDEKGRDCERLQMQYEVDSYWLMNADEFPGDEKALDVLLEKYPEIAILHYFKGVFLKRRSDTAAAREEFKKAEQLDDDRRTVQEYNAVVRSEAAASGAGLIDIVPLFSSMKDTKLFVDDCHPNANGHALITAEIVQDLFRKNNKPEHFREPGRTDR